MCCIIWSDNKLRRFVTIAKKSFRDLTSAEKQKRYAYAKSRRQRLASEMRAAGIIGAPREKMAPEERKAKRKAYSKAYRKTINAQAKAYRELMAQEGKPTRRGRKG